MAKYEILDYINSLMQYYSRLTHKTKKSAVHNAVLPLLSGMVEKKYFFSRSVAGKILLAKCTAVIPALMSFTTHYRLLVCLTER
jgi:hypothetical protein